MTWCKESCWQVFKTSKRDPSYLPSWGRWGSVRGPRDFPLLIGYFENCGSSVSPNLYGEARDYNYPNALNFILFLILIRGCSLACLKKSIWTSILGMHVPLSKTGLHAKFQIYRPINASGPPIWSHTWPNMHIWARQIWSSGMSLKNLAKCSSDALVLGQ